MKEIFAPEVVNNSFYREIAKLFDEITTSDASDKKLKHPGTNKQKQEFVVKLIGRVIFAWFLREKQSSSHIPLTSKTSIQKSSSQK